MTHLFLLATYTYAFAALFAIGFKDKCKGARGVMVIFVGNRHGDTSSNTGRD